jgi:hypothetical protein
MPKKMFGIFDRLQLGQRGLSAVCQQIYKNGTQHGYLLRLSNASRINFTTKARKPRKHEKQGLKIFRAF